MAAHLHSSIPTWKVLILLHKQAKWRFIVKVAVCFFYSHEFQSWILRGFFWKILPICTYISKVKRIMANFCKLYPQFEIFNFIFISSLLHSIDSEAEALFLSSLSAKKFRKVPYGSGFFWKIEFRSSPIFANQANLKTDSINHWNVILDFVSTWNTII